MVVLMVRSLVITAHTSLRTDDEIRMPQPAVGVITVIRENFQALIKQFIEQNRIQFTIRSRSCHNLQGSSRAEHTTLIAHTGAHQI